MATAPTPYCQTSDLTSYGAPAGALVGIDGSILQGAVDGANAEADSYLANIYTLPITTWGVDVTKFAAQIAIYDVFISRGFDPGSPELAQQIQDRAADARKWLLLVAGGKVTPTNITDSSGAPTQQEGPGGLFVVAKSYDPFGGCGVTVGAPKLRGY